MSVRDPHNQDRHEVYDLCKSLLSDGVNSEPRHYAAIERGIQGKVATKECVSFSTGIPIHDSAFLHIMEVERFYLGPDH